jgi:PQQ-dependent catabolism-associated CXXCW motif protein
MRAAAAFILAGVAFAAVAQEKVLDIDAVPGVRDRGREAYTAFLASLPSRAFAVGDKGFSGWRGGEATRAAAIAGALYNCNKLARNVCRVYAVDNEVVLSRYAQYDEQSVKARAEIRDRDFPFADYGDETREFPETPLRADGIRTMKTVELARMMASAVRPTLIDVTEGDPHPTLPNAWWIKGAGLTGREDPDADIRERLGLVLEGLVGGDKATPLVFFCNDAQCPLALAAARRVRGLGYTQVAWYRGGVQAWRAARLDTIESVQSGQVR